jgi:hypothetical protein
MRRPVCEHNSTFRLNAELVSRISFSSSSGWLLPGFTCRFWWPKKFEPGGRSKRPRDVTSGRTTNQFREHGFWTSASAQSGNSCSRADELLLSSLALAHELDAKVDLDKGLALATSGKVCT